MKIFSGSANKPLAEKIAASLGSPLSPLEIFIFPDGERRIWLEEDVVDQDAVVVQPTSTPVDQNYMELFFIIDALKRSGARSVTAVMPYFGYQRQDHIFRTGEAVSLQVVVKLLETMGVDKVIAYDLHSIKIPEEFHVPLIHLSALSVFAKTIEKKKWIGEETMLISPDLGGIRRIRILSDMLSGMPYGMTVKNRDLATGEIEINQIVDDKEQPVENITKRVLIVDDMASSGGTAVKAAELLKKHGAEEIYLFITHPVFSKEAPALLEESPIDRVITTDSVMVPQEKEFSKLEIVTIADEIANELKTS